MLSNDHIKQKLVEKFNEQVTAFEKPYGMLTFEAPKEINLKVLNFLYDDEELQPILFLSNQESEPHTGR